MLDFLVEIDHAKVTIPEAESGKISSFRWVTLKQLQMMDPETLASTVPEMIRKYADVM